MKFCCQLIACIIVVTLGQMCFAAEKEDPLPQPEFNAPKRTVEEVFEVNIANRVSARARLLNDNDAAWYTRWKLVREAKTSVDMCYFILDPDIFGRAMLGLLVDKARQGVKVRLMIDARGGRPILDKEGRTLLAELVNTGNGDVRVFNPLLEALLYAPLSLNIIKNVQHIIASNHDKILIADNEHIVTGGRNISQHYFSHPEDDQQAFCDADVVVSSPSLARHFKKAFDDEFSRSRNEAIQKRAENQKAARLLSISRRAMESWMNGYGKLPAARLTSAELIEMTNKVNDEVAVFNHLREYAAFRVFQGEHNEPTAILDKHSMTDGGELNEISPNLIEMIDACQEEIVIQNPYVVLTPAAKLALKRAHDRGVRIVIHSTCNDSTDDPLVQAVYNREWRKLAEAMPKAQFYVFENGERKLHAKVFVFDYSVTFVGTYNMDYRSEVINSEIICAIKSRPSSQRMRVRLNEALLRSRLLEPAYSEDQNMGAKGVFKYIGFLLPLFRPLM